MHALSNNMALLQLAVYGGTLVFFWILELYILSEKFNLKVLHTALNSKFLILVLPIQIILSLIMFFVASWTEASNWGLLYLFPFKTNSLLFFIVAFIILDFFDFTYHFMMHKTPVLWRFHQVHHSDMEVDITTTVREHPGETFIRVSYSILVIALVGASPWVLILKQTIQSLSNLASHTRIALPERLNNIISLVFVTPNTHHIHHHSELPYTDSNFGDVLTIWDRLFSTFLKMKQSDIVYGVDTNMDKTENENFKNLINRPFQNPPIFKEEIVQLKSKNKN
jgi:sterol desaturase/sphingolipid hydroxylase (fatty acid hydroxylase superfamily)